MIVLIWTTTWHNKDVDISESFLYKTWYLFITKPNPVKISKISVYSCERSHDTIQSAKYYAGQQVYSDFLDLFSVVWEKYTILLKMQIPLIPLECNFTLTIAFCSCWTQSPYLIV